MKRVTALLIALLLLVSFGTTAFAQSPEEEDSQENTGDFADGDDPEGEASQELEEELEEEAEAGGEAQDEEEQEQRKVISMASTISGINPERWADAQSTMNAAAGSGGRSTDLTSARLSPGGEIRIYLDAGMFVDENGDPYGADGDGITLAELRKGKITVEALSRKNANLIEDFGLKYDSNEGTSYLKIEMIDPFTGTGRRTVKATYRFKMNGKSLYDTEFQFEGQMSNESISLEADDDYIEMDGYTVADPDAYIKGITMDLGSGVTIIANLYPNKKYYAYLNITEGSDAVKDVDHVLCYQVAQSNLGAAGNVLRIQLPEPYYVYDGTGAYLGITGDDFPVGRVYYLTTEHREALEVAGGSSAESGRGGRGGNSGGQAEAQQAGDKSLDSWAGTWNNVLDHLDRTGLEVETDGKLYHSEIAAMKIDGETITLFSAYQTTKGGEENVLAQGRYQYQADMTDNEGRSWLCFSTEDEMPYTTLLILESTGEGGAPSFLQLRYGDNAQMLLGDTDGGLPTMVAYGTTDSAVAEFFS